MDFTLAVPGHPGVWALGDCAAVNDAKTGKPCPPTAQFAIREAATVARNIAAQLGGWPLKNFHFDSLGALCVVGHQTACAWAAQFKAKYFQLQLVTASCSEEFLGSPAVSSWPDAPPLRERA